MGSSPAFTMFYQKSFPSIKNRGIPFVHVVLEFERHRAFQIVPSYPPLRDVREWIIYEFCHVFLNVFRNFSCLMRLRLFR
jgi:hypothetical protein